MNRYGRSISGGRMLQSETMIPLQTSFNQMTYQPYGGIDSDLFCNLFTQPTTNFQSFRHQDSEPMECQLEYYQPSSMDNSDHEMVEYGNLNDFQQEQIETTNFPTIQQSHFSNRKEQVMMLLAHQRNSMVNRRAVAATVNNNSQFGTLQNAPITNPQFNQGTNNAPLKASQKSGPINKNQSQKQQQNNKKGNNLMPKLMPNSCQQNQKGNGSQTRGRRVMNPPMPLLPPPRSESLKNKKAVGASSNYNRSANSFNSNKSVAKKNNFVRMSIPTDQKKMKAVAIKSQTLSPTHAGPLPPQPAIVNGTRLMTGSVQMVAKWWRNNNSKQSKYPPSPPLFETFGILVDSDKVKKHVSQQRFALRNLPQWHIEDYLDNVHSISRQTDDELLQCYHFAIDELSMPLNGTIVRIIGVIPSSADGHFHCLKIRKAFESELTLIDAKVEKWAVLYGESRHNEKDVDEEPNTFLANQRSVSRFSYDAGYPEY